MDRLMLSKRVDPKKAVICAHMYKTRMIFFVCTMQSTIRSF